MDHPPMQCEGCGSTHVRRVRSTRVQRFMRLFTGKKRFLCIRCGWSALRAWDETAPIVRKVEKKDLTLVDRQS